MSKLSGLKKRIEAELVVTTAGAGATFALALQTRLQELAQAGDDYKRRASIAGQIGGEHRRWRGWLVEQITKQALGTKQPGRLALEAWQRNAFGRSINHCEIHGDPERAGGGRAGPEHLPNADTTEECTAIFQKYARALKRVRADTPFGKSVI